MGLSCCRWIYLALTCLTSSWTVRDWIAQQTFIQSNSSSSLPNTVVRKGILHDYPISSFSAPCFLETRDNHLSISHLTARTVEREQPAFRRQSQQLCMLMTSLSSISWLLLRGDSPHMTLNSWRSIVAATIPIGIYLIMQTALFSA